MFQWLGRLTAMHPGKILFAWVALALALTCIAPDWKNQAQDDDIRFLPPDTPSLRAYQLLEQAFPKDVSASKVIFALERPDRPLSGDDFALIDRLINRIDTLRKDRPTLPMTGVASYKDGPVGKRLISRDRHCVLVPVALSSPYLALQTREAVDAAEEVLRPLLAEVPDAPSLYVTGPAGIGRDLTKASAQSLDHTTRATVILVIGVLLLVYRSPLLALIPLVTIGIAVWVSLQLIAVATLIPGVHIVNISQVFCIVILFGAGTDYCLFLISRYREELEWGQEPVPGVTRSVRAVGGALAASAATVVCGLGMMGFAEFGKIRSAGPVIALGLMVGLFASLTITPALLSLGKRTVFWPGRVRLLQRPPSQQFWQRVAKFVTDRPHAVFFATLVPLVLLAIVGLRVSTSFRPTGDLSSSSGSVQGLEIIQKHYTAGETGPITVLLVSQSDWNSPAGKELLTSLSTGFGYLPNVAEVRSLTQPLGRAMTVAEAAPPVTGKPALKDLLARARQNLGTAVGGLTVMAAEPYYLSKIDGGASVTRIDIILNSDPFDASSIATLDLIETWLSDILPGQTTSMAPLRTETYGVTVHGRDLGKAVSRDRLRVNVLVAVGVFVILFVLVRKLWLAGYLLGTVLLSYLATLGLTAVYTAWLTGRPFGVIEWRVPFFLFTILVAVGEDYNILLISRIMQERQRHGMIDGVRRGLAATGGTITACGLIMAGTFGTLMLAELSTLKQIGFALGVGVLLDTFVVRPLLVPSFLVIVWRDAEPVVRVQRPLVERRRAA